MRRVAEFGIDIAAAVRESWQYLAKAGRRHEPKLHENVWIAADDCASTRLWQPGGMSRVMINVDNFARAESDRMFAAIQAQAGSTDGSTTEHQPRISSIPAAAATGDPTACPLRMAGTTLVRLYRPRAEILNGIWIFPSLAPTAG